MPAHPTGLPKINQRLQCRWIKVSEKIRFLRGKYPDAAKLGNTSVGPAFGPSPVPNRTRSVPSTRVVAITPRCCAAVEG